MNLPDIFHISWLNYLPEYSLTVDTAPETAYPIDNLQNQIANEPTVWDMTGLTSLRFTFGGTVQRLATCFGIHNHSMAIDAGARLRLFHENSLAGKLLIDTGGASIELNGSTQYLSVPDSAGNSASGKMRICARVKPEDSTPAAAEQFISKYETTGDQKAWWLGMSTSGALQLVLSDDGATDYSDVSTVVPDWSADNPISVSAVYNDITGLVTFYQYSEGSPGYLKGIDGADFDCLNELDLWEQIGDPVDFGVTGDLHDSSAPVLGGAIETNDASFTGDFIRAAAYSDDALIADIDARRYVTGATMSSETGDTVTLVGSPAVEITYDPVPHNVPFSASLAGLDPLIGYFESLIDFKTHYSTWFQTVLFRSGSIDLDIPTPVDDMLKIDKLWLGPAYGRASDYRYQITPLELSQHHRKSGGGLDTVEDVSIRTFACQFSDLTDSEDATFSRILAECKMSGDFMATFDPNDNVGKKFKSTSIYRRTSNAGVTADYFNGNSMGLAGEEN
jgi:hypothetical protein